MIMPRRRPDAVSQLLRLLMTAQTLAAATAALIQTTTLAGGFKPAQAQAPAAAVWTKQSGKHCSGRTVGSAYISSLSAAKAACAKANSGCSGVYDSGCDSSGSFYLCNVRYRDFQTSSSGCVYTKPPAPSSGRYVDGTGTSAAFDEPHGVAVSPDGAKV